jgi:hypothetical protein
MVSLRTLALFAVLTAVPAVQTQAFLLDFSGVPDGPMAAFTPVDGVADVATARSVNNEVGAGFGDLTGGGRGIELQSAFSVGSENDGASDSAFILSPLNTEVLNASNNWVGTRFQVDVTDGAANVAFIRENADNGGDDYAGLSVSSNGTLTARASNTLALGTYNANQWYNVAYDINFAGGTTDVYLDGVNMGSVTHDAVHTEAKSIAFFAFRGIDAQCNCATTHRGAPQVRIDGIATGSSLADVTIPEPASLSLLAVSGLLLLSRRRRV